MPTCPRCSASVQPGVAFCPSCGNSFASTAAPSSAYAAQPAPITYSGPQQTSGKAIGSLICALLFFIPFCFIVAIVLGHLALSDIKKSAGRLKGHGLAITGLVFGYGWILFFPVFLIIAAIAIPNLLRARIAANEASAVGVLRTYNAAIMAYAAQCDNVGFPVQVSDLGPGSGDCKGANLVDAMLADPVAIKSGYRFYYEPGTTDISGHVVSFTITADPLTENTTGARHFFVDQSGLIRYSMRLPATAKSPPLR